MTVNERDSQAAPELSADRHGPVLRLTLNRPGKRNALSRSLAIALREAIESAGSDGQTRVIILTGVGPSFCAGGDISQFANDVDEEQALADAHGLIGLYEAIVSCPSPIVARVHGPNFGGGVGLVCASDIVVASESARFSLSEARLGIVPAVVGPYVIAAIGAHEAKARMLLASPFEAHDALRLGMVHQCVPDDELDGAVDRVVGDLLACAPGALAHIKRLPGLVASTDAPEVGDTTARLMAQRITSEEGREGLRAFLEKRPASWMHEWPIR
jgi:methylglutaconyl-CoA hydratase